MIVYLDIYVSLVPIVHFVPKFTWNFKKKKKKKKKKKNTKKLKFRIYLIFQFYGPFALSLHPYISLLVIIEGLAKYGRHYRLVKQRTDCYTVIKYLHKIS